MWCDIGGSISDTIQLLLRTEEQHFAFDRSTAQMTTQAIHWSNKIKFVRPVVCIKRMPPWQTSLVSEEGSQGRIFTEFSGWKLKNWLGLANLWPEDLAGWEQPSKGLQHVLTNKLLQSIISCSMWFRAYLPGLNISWRASTLAIFAYLRVCVISHWDRKECSVPILFNTGKYVGLNSQPSGKLLCQALKLALNFNLHSLFFAHPSPFFNSTV